MEEEEEVLYVKVFDGEKGDVVFEGKVSRDVTPDELACLGCFRERDLGIMRNKSNGKQVKNFNGFSKSAELVAEFSDYDVFDGVLYVGAVDGVLRKSEHVPSCECVMMSLWDLTQEECEKALRLQNNFCLVELEMCWCHVRQIPSEMLEKMKKLKKLSLVACVELKSLPQEMGDLSHLEHLSLEHLPSIQCLPKRLKHLQMLKSIRLTHLKSLQRFGVENDDDDEDLIVFSKLNRITIRMCGDAMLNATSSLFWDMIKDSIHCRVLDLDYSYGSSNDQEIIHAALEENGSIVEGGLDSEPYDHFFKRNKANHKRAKECVFRMLALRRWRNALNHVPKEMVHMIAVMLWATRCDVKAWDEK